jgi:YVTN family beta-propeller protein
VADQPDRDPEQVFRLDAVDGTVTRIDANTMQVAATVTVGADPRKVACFGSAEGPSPPGGP